MNTEDTMIKHNSDKGITKGWHLDKRISITHIFATLSFAVGLGALLYALDNRVTLVEQTVHTNRELTKLEFTGVQAQLRAARDRDKDMLVILNRNYQNIIHRLERMEDRQIESLKAED